MSPAGREPVAIRHSVALPTASGRSLPGIAKMVERLGFDSLWLSEVDSDPPPARDALVLCSAIGIVTSEIGLVALLDPGARLPTVTAKAAAGADRMCGGRLALGLRNGEDIEVIRDTLDGRGPPNLPPPLGSVPLWVAGDDGDAPQTAARAAAGWFVGWNHGTSRVVQAVHRLEEECDAQGRDPRSVRVAVGATAVVDAAIGNGGAQPWTIDQAGQWVADMAGMGVTDLVLSFAPRPFGWAGESAAEIWAAEVLGRSSHQWRLRWW